MAAPLLFSLIIKAKKKVPERCQYASLVLQLSELKKKKIRKRTETKQSLNHWFSRIILYDPYSKLLHGKVPSH